MSKHSNLEFELINRRRVEQIKEMEENVSKEAYQLFYNWLSTATSDEMELRLKALVLQEKYFNDMNLRLYSKELTKIEMDGRVLHDDLSETLNINIDDWIVRYTDMGRGDGCCMPYINVIEVRRNVSELRVVLLHEMIHAFESILGRSQIENYKQYVIIKLYEKLSKRIPNLRKMIATDMHRYMQVHSPLFMLKSFDLDLRLKQRLGTIYRYGREEMFNG